MNNQRIDKILNWYQNEVEKDNFELQNDKNKFIKELKKIDKEKVFDDFKPKKYTLWQRIKKVLMNI